MQAVAFISMQLVVLQAVALRHERTVSPDDGAFCLIARDLRGNDPRYVTGAFDRSGPAYFGTSSRGNSASPLVTRQPLASTGSSVGQRRALTFPGAPIAVHSV